MRRWSWPGGKGQSRGQNPLGARRLEAWEGKCGYSTVQRGQQDGASTLFIGSRRRGKASGKRRRLAGDGKSMVSVLIQNEEGGEMLRCHLMRGKEAAWAALWFNSFRAREGDHRWWTARRRDGRAAMWLGASRGWRRAARLSGPRGWVASSTGYGQKVWVERRSGPNWRTE
jgi:hypothetical protein